MEPPPPVDIYYVLLRHILSKERGKKVQEDIREFCETGIISPGRMRAVDLNAAACGIQPIQLMESAGKSLAIITLDYQPERVLILCGKGNNGGDGMVAARHLQSCTRIDVVYPAGGMIGSEANLQLAALRNCAVTLHPISCAEDVRALEAIFSGADVIIDALLGIGTSGAPREPILSCIKLANTSPAPIIAADVPSPGIMPDCICSFHRPKVEGSMVIDIGIPFAAECFVGPGDLSLIPKKVDSAHKGAGGEVLIIGGGPYQGAPYLAGLAALRSGADLVRIASPSYLPFPDLIHVPLTGEKIGIQHQEFLQKLAKKADVVVCGCGLGKNSHNVVAAIAPYCRRGVFDADALTLPLPHAQETIFTPHAGEFQRMFGVLLPDGLVERGRLVKQFAEDATLLVKGSTDTISDGENVRFNNTGTTAMTVGGTGDILAGMCGALFCHLPAFEAACVAAYVNGRAGEACTEKMGEGLMASDLLNRIPIELFGGENHG